MSEATRPPASAFPGLAAAPDSGWQTKALLTLVIAAPVVAVVCLVVFKVPDRLIAVLLATLVALLLAGFPILIGFVQGISRARQLSKLAAIGGRPVAQTAYYVVAWANLQALQPASVRERDYRVPMLTFCACIVFCSFWVALSYSIPEVMSYPSVILGGFKVVQYGNEQSDHVKDIYLYQQGTFTAIAFAFFGAYVVIINRLLGRVGNNDIYPMSFHLYTAWILTAGVTAGVAHQALRSLVTDQSSTTALLLGFGCGLSPTLFLVWIARRAYGIASIVGAKQDPEKNNLPSNLNLLMIDGMTSVEIDRVSELGVTNGHILATQNPFALWPRLPYDLGLLVSWIAQAQLYIRVREDGMRVLRDAKIGDVFDYYAQLSDKDAQPILCDLLKVAPALAPAMLSSLDADPAFQRLKAVRDAMIL